MGFVLLAKILGGIDTSRMNRKAFDLTLHALCRSDEFCSLLAGWASWARHEVRGLFDVVHIALEHLKLVLSLDSVGCRCCRHRSGVQGCHLGLQSGNSLIFGHLHWLLGYFIQGKKRCERLA